MLAFLATATAVNGEDTCSAFDSPVRLYHAMAQSAIGSHGGAPVVAIFLVFWFGKSDCGAVSTTARSRPNSTVTEGPLRDEEWLAWGAGNRALESEPAPWRQRLPSGGGSAAIIDVSDAVE